MPSPFTQLKHATNAMVRRVSGLDLSRVATAFKRFKLEVFGERIETLDARLMRLSFFILDDASRTAMRATGSHLQFVHAGDGWFTVSPEMPEAAIGFEAVQVDRFFSDRGLDVRKRRFGDWSGRTGSDVGAQQQDLLLAFKR